METVKMHDAQLHSAIRRQYTARCIFSSSRNICLRLQEKECEGKTILGTEVL
jgi:hypothetical protein